MPLRPGLDPRVLPAAAGAPPAALPRRVAVSGGAGFIGSHSVEALIAAGVAVLVIDDLSHACSAALPAATDVLITDCGSTEAAEALKRFRPDAALHLAARGGVGLALRDPGTYVRTSVASSVAFFAAARSAGAAAIVTASSGGALYGDAPRLPAREELRPRPRSAYGASKLAEEGYLVSICAGSQVRTLALRYGNVYGPRQDGTGEAGVVAITCHRLLSDESPVIYGDGAQTRDFIYAADVVAANLAALGATCSGSFNIGTERETSVAEVVQTLTGLHNGGMTVAHAAARDGEVRRSCLGVARARTMLAWESRTPLKDGLRHTWEWFSAECRAAVATAVRA